MIIVSCDPGKTGAIVCVEKDKLVQALPTPMIKEANKLDVEKLHLFLNYVGTNYGVYYPVMEKVHAMPSDGRTSVMSFGRITGAVEAMLHLHSGTVPEEISPAMWKRHWDLIKTEKKEAIALAASLQPDVFDHTFQPTKKTINNNERSGIADAYLMARYLSYKLRGE